MKNDIPYLPKGAVLHGQAYDYCIEKVLGHGTFGITYLASVRMRGGLGQLDTNVQVAIKEFFMHEINGREGTSVTCGSRTGIYAEYREKFVREARNLSKMKHPGIVKVMEQWEENQTAYFSMEYIDGRSLDIEIKNQGELSEADALKYAKQIGEALKFMHSKGMLHLDLKPSNVMLKGGQTKLIDFGLSKQYDDGGNPESSTSVGSGTPGYAPLEQANNHDGKSFPVTMDIYALGATMYKMITGMTPPLASEILNDGLPIKEMTQNGASAQYAQIVEKAMEPKRADRYQTVDEMLKALNGFSAAEKEVELIMEENEATEIDGEETTEDKQETKEETGQVVQEQKKIFVWDKPLIVVVILACVCFLIGGLMSVNKNKGDSEEQTEKEEQVVTEDATTGTANGYEWVDLGLSVKWATCNVGASSPSDYGDYFAWGETSPKSEYTVDNCEIWEKSMSDIGGNSQYDAARANWGGRWRLPTKAEFDELLENCTWTWTSQGGHNGYRVKSKKNGGSIFLPAGGLRYSDGLIDAGEGGYFWSSTPRESDTQNAYYLSFYSSNHSTNCYYRYFGRTVRPVIE